MSKRNGLQPTEEFDITGMIDRQLRYELRSESRVIAQSDLLGIEGPLVILGEPGMGKSTLARWLGSQNGFVLTSARKLIAHPNPRQCSLKIPSWSLMP